VMKEIILYRYHNHPELVRSRLKLIQRMEPDKPIYGIFGGKATDYHQACHYLKDLLEDNYLIPVSDPRWKWLHADITYKMWFREVGQYIGFDRAYILEWDLLMLEQLNNLYPNTEANKVVCTGLIPLEKVSKFWYWTNAQNRPKVESFYNKVSRHYNQSFVRYASLGPGLCVPKAFFEGLNQLTLIEADISDEIKIPVWSQIMGLKPVSNDFYKKWFSFFSMRFFNANVANIQMKTIRREMQKQKGRRVFHPFRDSTDSETLYQIYRDSKKDIGHYTSGSMNHVKSVRHPLAYKMHCKLVKMRHGQT